MPEIDIPLFTGVYKNIDETVNNDKSFRLMDGILDEAPSIFSRPGLSALVTSSGGKAFDGLFWCDSLSKLFGISGGKLYSYTTAFVETDLSAAGVSINVGVRPAFAYDGSRLLVANGGQIMYTNGTAATAFLSDAQAPTSVSHIFMLDSYLIANNTANDTWYFSEPGDTTAWNALDFASAESEPDKIIAGMKFRSEAFFFGRQTLEVWEDDGQTPFIRVNGGAFDTGCIAPYSPIALDNEVMWLSDDRRFVKFGGGGIEKIATQYDKEISRFTTVTDCTSDRYDILGKTLIVFQFPSEQRTLVYNLTNDNWSEFGYWDSVSGSYQAFLGACHAFLPDSGIHVVGSRKQDGKLYQMSDEFLTDNGDVIRMCSTSGHINYGTNNMKKNNSLSIRVKRGYITDASEPVAVFRYRDDAGEWSNEIQFSLGEMGDYFNVVKLFRLGCFRSRQYEFICSDPVGLVFSEAREDLDQMAR